LLNSKNQIFAFSFYKPDSERVRLILFFAFIAFFTGCDFKNKTGESEAEKGKKIATIYERDIYASEVTSLNKKDSALIATNYLEDLATKEALYLKAQESGLVDDEAIEIQIERFRKSLVSAHFESEYVKQKLDTTIKEEELAQFFKKNESFLMLHSAIFKGDYVVLPANSNKVVRLKELLLSEKPVDIQELKNFCVRYATSYSIENKNWVELPIQINRVFAFTHEGILHAIKHKQLLSFEKDDNLYLIRLFDYKFANQPSPYSYIREELVQLLLNERKAEIIAELKSSLLSEAKANKKIEIY
jgi:hypothetical protein